MSEIEINSIDTGVSTQEWSKEISQEDIIRVNESLGEARKYRGKIWSSVASNSKLAEFIKHLVMSIDDNEFWERLDCFWITSALWEPLFLAKTFVACLLPLYEEKADELWLSTEFPLDYHFVVTFQTYMYYIQQLFAHDQESWRVDEKQFIQFITMVIKRRSITLSDQDSLHSITIPVLQQTKSTSQW